MNAIGTMSRVNQSLTQYVQIEKKDDAKQSGDTVAVGGSCTPDIRNQIASLRMQAASNKSTAGKLLAIGLGIGAICAAGSGNIGMAIGVSMVTVFPAGIHYFQGNEYDKKANILEKQYNC